MAKKHSEKKKKPLRALIVFLSIILALAIIYCGAVFVAVPILIKDMEPAMRDQIQPSLLWLPPKLLSYPFKAKTNAAVVSAKDKVGGFMKGICHPSENYDLIKGAGIQWDRADIPFPYETDENSKLSEGYINWKAKMQGYVDNGISILAVTPYPSTFLQHGIDPRLPENDVRIQEVAKFLITDLKDLIKAVQISNELGVARFMDPLDSAGCVHFMAIQLEAVAPVKGDIIVGYNSAGPQVDQHTAMRPYHKYCDYIGVDIYGGCFGGLDIMNWLPIFDLIPAFLYSLTGLPIIMAEFGYISGGAPKTQAERDAILNDFGFDSEEAARADIDNFITKLPERFRKDIEVAASNKANFVFGLEMRNHLYREMPANIVLKDFPHSPEGQADYYEYMIPHLAEKPYIIGEFIYSWADDDICYVCGFSDCPIETRWGIVTFDEQPKLSYAAVKNAFESIK
ncbi:MAG: hypothetical protein LBT21_02965 [Oscillospiraceae bacterium]|jgi:hypothetical protein|nr:hypothetical protein [Oscillospiraceae bacterium]